MHKRQSNSHEIKMEKNKIFTIWKADSLAITSLSFQNMHVVCVWCIKKSDLVSLFNSNPNPVGHMRLFGLFLVFIVRAKTKAKHIADNSSLRTCNKSFFARKRNAQIYNGSTWLRCGNTFSVLKNLKIFWI